MYVTTPRLKKSDEGSAKVQLRTSGAMKPTVPTNPVLKDIRGFLYNVNSVPKMIKL